MRGKELEWVGTSLSDVDSVKGLLKLRKDFDMIFENKYFSVCESGMSASTHIAEQMEETSCTYIQLDQLIKGVEFTEQQRNILNRYMLGYEVEDIAEEDELSVRNVDKIVDTICKSIVDESLRQWRIWSYTYKLELKTKKCSRCGETLPLTDELYGYDNTNNRYKSQCLKCVAEAKKTWRTGTNIIKATKGSK